MITSTDLPEALDAEYALRAKRAAAIDAVTAQLQAARKEAEGESSAAATVVAALRSRSVQLKAHLERLEEERAAALAPTAEVLAAQAALAEAVERSRAVPIGDDGKAMAAAHAQADAEDALSAAQRDADARNLRPLDLRLQIAIDQVAAAERELDAAERAADAADQALRGVLVDLLRLLRDAAAIALDETTVDLNLAGGTRYATATQMVLGESNDLLAALGTPLDFYFGRANWRTQQMGRFDPALLLDQAQPMAPGAAAAPPAAGRKPAKLLAA